MVRGVVAALAIAAAARAASASPIRLEVTSDTCGFDSLESQLAQVAGSDPVEATAVASVRIEASNVRDAYEARIFFDDGAGAIRGPRVVASRSCEELVKSVALVIAMALPDLPVAEPVTPPAPHVEVNAAPRVEERPAIVVSRYVPAAASVPVGIDVLAAGAGGVTSRGVQAQLILGARLRRGAASVGAELRADAPQELDVTQMSRISVFRTQVSVSPCLHAGAFAGCAVASAGTIRGAGQGLVSARSAYVPLLAGGARVTWEHAMTPGFALRLHIDLDALLSTSQFDVDHMQVWVSPRFEGSAGFGIVAHIP